jgi:hypothetical protein
VTGSELEDLRAVSDPVERARRATEVIDGETELIAAISAIRQEALELLRNKMTNAEIAKATGLTRARVSQLLGSAPPERALLTPEAGSVLTIAVVQKQDPDSGQPVIGTTTRKALDALKDAAKALGVSAREEEIAPPGVIDLNRGNLAVMMGPRTSALIAQAVSADPVIKWQQDGRGRWYVTDTRTGTEYHSGYDDGWQGGPDGERECFAHVGRVRRPDGRGTFLYLGGAHSPGTAGAVAYFTREMPSLWDQAHKSAWSAVVRTVTSDAGAIVSAELATPVYVHGRI